VYGGNAEAPTFRPPLHGQHSIPTPRQVECKAMRAGRPKASPPLQAGADANASVSRVAEGTLLIIPVIGQELEGPSSQFARPSRKIVQRRHGQKGQPAITSRSPYGLKSVVCLSTAVLVLIPRVHDNGSSTNLDPLCSNAALGGAVPYIAGPVSLADEAAAS